MYVNVVKITSTWYIEACFYAARNTLTCYATGEGPVGTACGREITTSIEVCCEGQLSQSCNECCIQRQGGCGAPACV